MKKYVYLGGPIAGHTSESAKWWREDLQNHFKSTNIRMISPLRCEPEIGEGEVYDAEGIAAKDCICFGSDKAIHAKNMLDVKSCDLMIACMFAEQIKSISLGTMLEIGWASALGKPIILITDDDRLKKHPVVKESVNWIVPTLEDAQLIVYGLFNDYV